MGANNLPIAGGGTLLVAREKNMERDSGGECETKQRLIATCLYNLHHYHFTVSLKFLQMLI